MEKIISKLVAELRVAKLQAAGAEGSRVALAAFTAITRRLEASLAENISAVASLSGTVRKGCELVVSKNSL